MLDRTPVVTVVVPLYNTERYIDETLRSIAAQTFTDYEVVVVNDASTDNGPAIVERWMANDARIRMVTQDNRGLAGARNGGIRAARGEYIALLDADDLWLPMKLERHVAHLDANPSVGVSFAPSRFIDGDSKALSMAQTPRLKDIDAAHVFCRNPVGNGSAAVIRRRALDDIAFVIAAPEGPRTCWFDETFRQSEDIELWCRIAATTRWRFEGVPEALTLYRVSTGGLSANVEKQFETWSRMRDKLAGIAPAFVGRHGRRSEAYQRRYLARRLVMNGEGTKSLSYAVQALRLYPRLLIEEPGRTLATLLAAGGLAVLPQSISKAAPALMSRGQPGIRRCRKSGWLTRARRYPLQAGA